MQSIQFSHAYTHLSVEVRFRLAHTQAYLKSNRKLFKKVLQGRL